MKKNSILFKKWSVQKQKIHFSNMAPFFREGEIRWVTIGENIGTEVVGKGSTFSRPVLIFRKLYGHSCLAIPLTSQKKEGSYFFEFHDTKKKCFYALLTQVRYIDGRRIGGKISFISPSVFVDVQNAFFSLIKNIPHSKTNGGGL